MSSFCSCPKCNAMTQQEGEGPPPHGRRFRCGTCGKVWWLGKERVVTRLDTPDDRRAFKQEWRRLYGGTFCAFCQASKITHPERSFQLDHKMDLSAGGANELWNTQVLCGLCHTLKNNISTREKNRTSGDKPEGW